MIKIKLIRWSFLCFLKFLWKGKANQKIAIVRKVVVIQDAKLGDMVCTTPMFRAIKSKYPDCKIIVVGDRINRELLEHNSDVDKYLVWKKGGSITSLIRRLKEERVDFGCVIGPSFEGLVSLFLAGIPLVAAPKIVNGWSPYETKAYRLVRKFCVTKPHRMKYYAPGEYLRLLEPINIFSSDTVKHLGFSVSGRDKIENLWKENNFSVDDLIVGIAPGAGNKIKQWPAERFALVADYVIESHKAKVIIIGGKKDLEESEEMIKNLKNINKVVNTTDKLSIDELKALISKLDLFIAADTGSIYIAEACGVPTVDIVGPVDEREQPPISPVHKVVVAERDKPELYVMNARVYDAVEARRQVEGISVPGVCQACRDLLIKLG